MIDMLTNFLKIMVNLLIAAATLVAVLYVLLWCVKQVQGYTAVTHVDTPWELEGKAYAVDSGS